MDVSEVKLVIEAALLAAGRPLPLEKIVELFSSRGDGVERATIREALDALSEDYAERGIELKEVASGYRVQIRSSMSDWLQPLWEERAPRYTRALLETLALIAYRQPITRGEIEEVRGVAVSSNIVRTLMERGWVRVVGHREVPGKPAMLGTTREFLDYFGLSKLEDLPTLADLQDEFPQSNPQGDFIDTLNPVASAADGTHADSAAEDAIDSEDTDVAALTIDAEDSVAHEARVAQATAVEDEMSTSGAADNISDESDDEPGMAPVDQSIAGDEIAESDETRDSAGSDEDATGQAHTAADIDDGAGPNDEGVADAEADARRSESGRF